MSRIGSGRGPSLEGGRALLAARLRTRFSEIEQAILACVHAVPDSTGMQDTEYVGRLPATVTALVDYGLTGIEHGEERSGPIPVEALAQAHRAARSCVSLETVLRRYLAGHALLGDFIVQEAQDGGLLCHGSVLRWVQRTQTSMLDRLIVSISEEYRRASSERVTPDENGRISVVLGQFGVVIGRGLREVLSEDCGLRIVNEDLDHSALEVAIAEMAPQVAVLGEDSTGSVLKRLWAIQPDIGLVVFAYRPSRAYGARLLGSGVAACLPIDATAPEILGAIRLVADGKPVFASVPDGSIQAAHYAGMASLTPREREVLRLLSLGEPNAGIALTLSISIETVRTHVRHILAKLGVGKRQELVGIAIPERFGYRQ